MSEERLQVLQMVAAGTITPDQGEDLLAALGPANSMTTGSPGRHGHITGQWSRVSTSGSVLGRLSEARLHGVTPEYIRSLAEFGYRNLPLEVYVGLHDHGVTPEYIREMKAAGYTDLTLDELKALRTSGINPEYVREMIELGFGEDDATANGAPVESESVPLEDDEER
jgi:SHOCT-like protein